MTTASKIKELYIDYKFKCDKYGIMESEFDADFQNEELERQLDEYYDNVLYPVFTELLNAVMSIGIDAKTARLMIDNDEFKRIIDMYSGE